MCMVQLDFWLFNSTYLYHKPWKGYELHLSILLKYTQFILRSWLFTRNEMRFEISNSSNKYQVSHGNWQAPWVLHVFAQHNQKLSIWILWRQNKKYYTIIIFVDSLLLINLNDDEILENNCKLFACNFRSPAHFSSFAITFSSLRWWKWFNIN